MSRIVNWIGSLLLITSTGFTEILITAQDYAVDSDVVLESAVREIKSAPADTINAVGDSIKYLKDETITAAGAAAAVFQKDLQESAKKDAVLDIENAWDSSNDIVFRDYRLSAEIGDVLMTGIEAGDDPNVDVRGFFKGLEFPDGTSAYYMPRINHLFVLQTLDNILSMESVLADYQNGWQDLMGHQVEIEAKFLEVSQKSLNELGFRWNFNGKGASGDAKLFGDLVFPAGQDILWDGLRTTKNALSSGVDPAAVLLSKTTGSLRWDLYISALERADDSDVLSAPRVVTRDGTTAIIRVGEEQWLPKAFDINAQDTSPFVEHTDWDLELMGVQLEVTPELREGGLIDLKIIPTVKEIVGYDTYLILPEYAYANYNGTVSEGPFEPLNASLPYFRTRQMETRVTVADGSTVGMGGLIYDKLETFRDKVPVLGSIPFVGRLFRSEGEKSVKRNLIIFVTAAQVDIDGRKISDLAIKK
jgi:type II secretory pathway component GspD/PulD (secretin)